MNTLVLAQPGIFVMMMILGAILQSFMSHVAKAFFLLNHKVDDLRAEFDEAVANSNAVVDNAEDKLKNEEDIHLAQAKEVADLINIVNELKNRLASLKVVEANMEEMKDIVGRHDALMVMPRDLERATEGFMTYPSVRDFVAEACARVTAEAQTKAADMIFQSEAIQRRRLELVRKALEALTLHAEQEQQVDLASFVARSEMATYVGREELMEYATRSDLVSFPKKEELAGYATRTEMTKIQEELKALAVALPALAPAKEAEYYQGWMATAEMNGIKAEVEMCNIQLRTKAENKAWLDEENKDALANRESFMSERASDPSGWTQGTNSAEYIKRTYKAGEWSTGVKAEYKLTFPVPPPATAGLPPPPPRDGSMCRDIFNKLTPLLTWERVLLAADSV